MKRTHINFDRPRAIVDALSGACAKDRDVSTATALQSSGEASIGFVVENYKTEGEEKGAIKKAGLHDDNNEIKNTIVGRPKPENKAGDRENPKPSSIYNKA